jgi:site-specific recombinase XerD
MIESFSPQPQDLLPLRSGSLGPHLESFAALLARQGYCQRHGWRKVRLVAALSQWLAEHRLPVDQLDEKQTTTFLRTRRKPRRRFGGEFCTLTLLLRHLRQIGAIPASRPPVMRSSLDRLVRDYEQFLRQERGLVPVTISESVRMVRRFLRHRFPAGQMQLRQLRASDAFDFILHEGSSCGRRYLQSTASRLRSFLRFLLQRGKITAPLASAVPTVAARRLSELPKFLEAVQVEQLLGSCDRRLSLGRRDYAILLLLARLGLRAAEVAQLSLEDLDWRAGAVCVRGKGQRVDRLPLPQDVGQAVASYLKMRRGGGARRVFLRSYAPYEGVAATTVASVVQRAVRRAGLHPSHQGAHLLRHSLATRMLRSGASLAQIGQVLRHQLAQTTEIYAKVDLKALLLLAHPWPGGAR